MEYITINKFLFTFKNCNPIYYIVGYLENEAFD